MYLFMELGWPYQSAKYIPPWVIASLDLHSALFSRQCNGYTESTLEVSVEGQPSQQRRRITHFQYTSWPDFSCPASAESFIEMVNRTDEAAEGRPMVVHCSAGLGRTGVFVVVHTALKCHRAGRKVNIESIVTRLRQQRGGVIQTQEQYQFCLEAVAEAVSPRWRPRAQTGLPQQRPRGKDTRPFSEPPREDQDTPQTQRRKLYLQHSLPPPPPFPPPYSESEPQQTVAPRAAAGSMKQKTPSSVTATKSFASPPPPTSSPPPPLTPSEHETTPSDESLDESDTELIQRKLAALKDDSPERELIAAARKPHKPTEKRTSADDSAGAKDPLKKRTSRKRDSTPLKQPEEVASRGESVRKDNRVQKPRTAAAKLESRKSTSASRRKSSRDDRRLSKEEMETKLEGFEIPEFTEEERGRDALEEEEGEEEAGFEIGDEPLLSKPPEKKKEQKPRKPGLPPAWSKLPPSPKIERRALLKVTPPLVVNRAPDEVQQRHPSGRLVIPSAFGGTKSEEHKDGQDQVRRLVIPSAFGGPKSEKRKVSQDEEKVAQSSTPERVPAVPVEGYSKWQAASAQARQTVLQKKQQSATDSEVKPSESGDTPPVLRMIRHLEVKNKGSSSPSPSPRPSPRPSPTHKPLEQEQAKPVEQTKKLSHRVYIPTPIVPAMTSRTEKEQQAQPPPPSETSGGNVAKLLARFQ